MVESVVITKIIKKSKEEVFDWFYKSENYVKSPIVFKSKWREGLWTKGSKRDIIMVAGWYFEEITAVKKNEYIQYKVNKSFPAVKQDFTQIYLESIDKEQTKVTWTIDISVPTPLGQGFLNKLAGKMAGILYKTILNAGAKELEN